MNARVQVRIWENFQLLKIAQIERVKQDLDFSYMERTQRQEIAIVNLRGLRIVQKAGKETLTISTRFDLVLQSVLTNIWAVWQRMRELGWLPVLEV